MNEVEAAFRKFLRERKGGPAVDREKLSELLDAFEAGTQFGLDHAFAAMKDRLAVGKTDRNNEGETK